MRCTALHSSSFTEDHRGNNVSICKQGVWYTHFIYVWTCRELIGIVRAWMLALKHQKGKKRACIGFLLHLLHWLHWRLCAWPTLANDGHLEPNRIKSQQPSNQSNHRHQQTSSIYSISICSVSFSRSFQKACLGSGRRRHSSWFVSAWPSRHIWIPARKKNSQGSFAHVLHTSAETC